MCTCEDPSSLVSLKGTLKRMFGTFWDPEKTTLLTMLENVEDRKMCPFCLDGIKAKKKPMKKPVKLTRVQQALFGKGKTPIRCIISCLPKKWTLVVPITPTRLRHHIARNKNHIIKDNSGKEWNVDELEMRGTFVIRTDSQWCPEVDEMNYVAAHIAHKFETDECLTERKREKKSRKRAIECIMNRYNSEEGYEEIRELFWKYTKECLLLDG